MMNVVCAAAVMAVTLAACSGEGGRNGAASSGDSGANAAGSVVSDAAFASASSYVGIRYDSLPKTFTFVSGALLPKSAGAMSGAFDLDRIRTPRGDMVWLDSIIRVAGQPRPTRIVRAELKVPPLAADERLVMSSCEINASIDARVVAIIVVNQDPAHTTTVRQAWRANLKSGDFDVIPVTGVNCADPG
jgi:hypothetical protein